MTGADGLVVCEDGAARCRWGVAPDDYRAYHDDEWGRPVGDDTRLFEKLCLEGFQSGLSWLTILRRREGFRRAFAGFDAVAVASFGSKDVERLLGDPSIIRHRGKIEATIRNAGCVLRLLEAEGSLARYIWRFEPVAAERPDRVTGEWLAANPSTAASTGLARDLRRRGFSFVGPTTVYAFMQAMGLVNDHVHGCVAHGRVEHERAHLTVRSDVQAGSTIGS